jgi:hypothetical protein
MTTRNAPRRALLGFVLVLSGVVASSGIPVAAATPATDAAPKVADACSLLKPKQVKKALRAAPKSMRPIQVDRGVATSPTTGASATRACALGLLLRKNLGGSVQVFASPVRKGVCPPSAKRRDRTQVSGKRVVLVRSGKGGKLRGVVFARNGTCVSVATVLSDGRSVPRAAYLALAGSALRKLGQQSTSGGR